MSIIRRARRGAAAVALVALTLTTSAPPANAASPILGGGSSFATLFHDQWAGDVGRPPLRLGVTYQGSGSNQGRSQFTAGVFDFAGSDTPYLATETKPSRPFVYVPVMAGGLAFMFRIEGNNGSLITELKLDARTVCRVFTDPNMTWRDPEILALNPELVPVLPDIPVQRIVRSDGSGTSYVLSEFCISTSPDVWGTFQTLVQSKPESNAGVEAEFREGRPISRWPVAWGPVDAAPASDGVADSVQQDYDGRKGKITYVEYGAAKLRGLPVARMRNGANQFVLPEDPNVEIALKYASANLDAAGELDGTFTLAYAANDPQAYFPSTYSYVIAPLTGDAEKLSTLTQYLQYAVTGGQGNADPLGYDPLSCPIAELALKQTAKIPGAGAASSPCGGVVDANTIIDAGAVASGTVSNPSGSSTAGAGGTGGTNQSAGATGDQASGSGASGGTGAATGNQGTSGSAAPGSNATSASGATAGSGTAAGGTGAVGSGTTGAGAAATGPTGASTASDPTATAADGSVVAGADTDVDESEAVAAASSPIAAAGTGSRRSAAAGGGAGTFAAAAGANDALLAANQAPNLDSGGGGAGGPSNADVLWTLLAGATLAAAGILFARRSSVLA